LTLICLEQAMQRVEDGWTSDLYIGEGGEVCGVGAVMAADGLEEEPDVSVLQWIETLASDTAKEAIELLNASAVKLYPGSQHHLGFWCGSLEHLNQEVFAGDEYDDLDDEQQDPRKARVLEVYRDAIETRREHAGVPA